jgi:membrane fusion protein (multidrug efflux system)
LLEAEAARARLTVLERELQTRQFERDSLALQVEQKQVILDDHRIIASGPGLVDKTFVNAGEYVVPGQRLVIMHDPDDIWVDANVKETEVRYLQPGQVVKVTVDAYTNQKFEGVLERIGNAATSQFSLLPSANPSGNFTKVTQRIPVRISLEQQQGLLKPGMMVEVAIEHR